jgi:hypothetical protein
VSKTFHSLSFGICVNDSDHWKEEDHEAALEPQEELAEVMKKAGNEFIAAHPHLFCGELV